MDSQNYARHNDADLYKNHADLCKFIESRIIQIRKTHKNVATDAGISRSYLYKLLGNDDIDISIRVIYRLAKALEISPIALFRFFGDLQSGLASPKGWNIRTRQSSGLHEKFDKIAINKDSNTPSYATYHGGEAFLKQWEIQNTGKIPWEARRLINITETPNNSLERSISLLSLEKEITLPATPPGGIIRINIIFSTPTSNSSAHSLWQIQDKKGEPCYETDFLLIASAWVFSG